MTFVIQGWWHRERIRPVLATRRFQASQQASTMAGSSLKTRKLSENQLRRHQYASPLRFALLAAQATAQAQDQRRQAPYGPGMMGQGRDGMMGRGMGMDPGDMMGPQGTGIGGTMARRHQAMMQGPPEPYAGMTNPLPRTPETISKGAGVYVTYCASCHGRQGLGNGEAGRALSPPPTNWAALSQMPPGQWDAYLYWSTAEGGAPIGSGMSAYKDVLSDEQIWSVVSFIQVGLPDAGAMRQP
jgi:mono/diheme cytochrome c family protein